MDKRIIEIELDPEKNVYENAAKYFDEAKKLKEKLERLKKHIENAKAKLEEEKKGKSRKKDRNIFKGEWYEKFRWFFTSHGFLFVIGKDAETNEILVKKYSKDWDIVFHTDIHGSPFGVLKTQKKEVPEEDLRECATFIACFSRAWKYKLYSIEVYWVRREQVSKRAPSGEYLKKGSFMIYGKKNYIRVELEYGVGVNENNEIIWGPGNYIRKNAKKYFIIIPGDKEVGEIVKEISKGLEIDENIIRKIVPPWNGEIKEKR